MSESAIVMKLLYEIGSLSKILENEIKIINNVLVLLGKIEKTGDAGDPELKAELERLKALARTTEIAGERLRSEPGMEELLSQTSAESPESGDKEEQENPEEFDIENDIYVPMEPVSRTRVKIRAKSLGHAKPLIVIDAPLDD